MDPFAIPVAFFLSVSFAVVGVSFARALSRRYESRRSGFDSADVVARLERMEQAIDAIAVEVERISEAQRFTTRLLSEKAGAPGLPPGER